MTFKVTGPDWLVAFQQLQKIKKTNDVTENLHAEDVDVYIHTITLQKIIKIENTQN